MSKIFLRHRHEFITNSEIQSERRAHLPVVLEISAELFLAPIENLHGLMNLSSREFESGRQVCFHLIDIAGQECVEGVERINPVVAAINLVHHKAHRIVFRSNLERVIGSRDRQIVAVGIEILEEQCAVPGESHTRDLIAVVELSHALPI
jgi:hypothetical protein